MPAFVELPSILPPVSNIVGLLAWRLEDLFLQENWAGSRVKRLSIVRNQALLEPTLNLKDYYFGKALLALVANSLQIERALTILA